MKNLFLSLVITTTLLYAQIDNLWTKTYDGDFGYSFDKTSEGGYIISGSSLVKTDSQGDTLWTKSYSSLSVIESNDGGYVLTGGGSSDGLSLIKTNLNGDIIWQKIHPLVANDNALNGIGVSIVQAEDGGYVIAGNSDYETFNHPVLLLKTDSQGDTLWTKSFFPYGGARQVIESNDGGFVVVGWTQGKTFLIKTDSDGNTLWTNEWFGENGQAGYSLDKTTDDGFVITGYLVNENDITVIKIMKTDSAGNLLWVRDYGIEGIGYSIKQTTDEGFITAGKDNGRLVIIKTSANGDSLWTKFYGNESNGQAFGGYVSILESSDGGFIVAGNLHDLILVKTDSDGNIQTCKTGFINYGTDILIDCFFEQDLEFLQLLIDNSQVEASPPPPDLSPFDLGVQHWDNGRIIELCISNGIQGNCPVDSYRLNIELPPEVGNLDSLHLLDLKGGLLGNQMIGEIPIEIWSLNNLSNLNLSVNQFSGVLPESICELDINWSEDFYINDNYLCPPYPSCIEDYVGEQDLSNCENISIVDEVTPLTYKLYNAYPNPFNPSTTLHYDLPNDEFVSITIYDMLGNVISNLVDDNQNSGYKSIQWDATNNQGQQVSAGVYLYSIEAGEFRQTKKMILLK